MLSCLAFAYLLTALLSNKAGFLKIAELLEIHSDP